MMIVRKNESFVSESWNLFNLLEVAAEKWPERIFLSQERNLSYRQVLKEVNRLAQWLAGQNVRKGDRVLIVMENRVESIFAIFAAARIGAVFVILHNEIKSASLEKICAQCQPALAILDKSACSLAGHFESGRILWVGDDSLGDQNHAYGRIGGEDGACLPVWTGSEADPAALVYTSGSTGQPRGVTISHANIRFSTQAIQSRLGYRESDRISLFLPLSFDYGLYQVFLAANVGSALCLSNPEAAGPRLVQYLTQNDVSVFPAVPTLAAGLLKLLERKPACLPHLRMLTNTGDRLPESHVFQLNACLPEVKVYSMYGLTECKRVAILLPEEWKKKPGSVGRPLDGTFAAIVDARGEKLPPGSVGELVVEGPHVTLGYWEAKEETDDRFVLAGEGTVRLLTGDYCRMDEDGYLYFVSRMDSLIKYKGYRINPLEIEEVAASIHGIAEVSVCLHPEKQELLCFIVKSRDDVTAEEIRRSLAEKIERHKMPDQIWTVAALPKNQNGKVARKRLLECLSA